MRRFLTLVGLLGLAIPAGVSISGCYRNPAGKYCPVTSGYGLLQTQVAAISLQPQTIGMSLAYGQTAQAPIPAATNCLGARVGLTQRNFIWGTTNNQLLDISPVGTLCAGTWNRNTGGGIADYTYCNPPNPLPTTGGLPYSVTYLTATYDSVSSNPFPVYIHAPVTSISLDVPPPPGTSLPSSGAGPANQCYSQGQIAQLDAEACYYTTYNGVANQYELCAPASVSASGNYACPGGLAGVKSVPVCESSIGTMNFSVANSVIASINSTNNQITAEQPGTTAITASIAGSGSSAGYFSTCPPASISVALANGATSGTVTQGVPLNLTTTVLDTRGNTITGLGITYQSTNPISIQAGAGSATATFPGSASITAICQPPACNSAPINELGFNGTGLPLSSNSINLTSPGTASDYLWLSAPGASQYFVPIELFAGTLGSTVRLPYVPNSMMMDQAGLNLYFGSPRELMTYSTATDKLSSQVGIPGVVLAVSPDGNHVLVNDQARHLFYLYPTSSGTTSTFSGMGNAAEWTPDSQTLYITDNSELNTPASCGSTLPITGHTDTLYVYNASTGWTTYPLPPSPLPPSEIPSCTAQPNTAAALPGPQQTPAILIPSVGAYLRGDPTDAHTWCASGTVGNQASIQSYPQGDSQPVQSDVLAATQQGHHVLGAAWNAGNTITLSDLAVTIPSGLTNNGISTPAQCQVTVNSAGVQTMLPLTLTSTVTQQTIPGVSASSVNQVVTGSTPVPVSGSAGTSLAFITYNGTATGASLPYYLPAPGGAAGALRSVTLSDCAATLANGSPNPAYPCNAMITGPIVGAFSPDNTIFFVSTAGDNEVHYISIPSSITSTSVPADTQQISPSLPGCDPSLDSGCTYTGTPGSIVPATAMAVKPRPKT